MRLTELAEFLGGRLCHARDNIEIVGVNTLRDAGPNEAAFLSNMRYKKEFESSKAGVVLLGEEAFKESRRPTIRVKDPYLAFAKLQRHLHPPKPTTGFRHPSAVIHESARLAEDVDVGACAVIGAGVEIGAGSRIGAGCVIGEGAIIGKRCTLHPRSVVAEECILGDDVVLQAGAIVGSDGFGYAWDGSAYLKIPQCGKVRIENGVEIGANTCIDRGAIGDTVIKQGVKLDNLIQIGHNVEIGPHTIMAAQVGISGSSRLGSHCQLGGQVGIAGHLHIETGCRIAAQSGVMSDLPANGVYAGSPAMPHRLWLKASALFARLPEIWARLLALEGRRKGGRGKGNAA